MYPYQLEDIVKRRSGLAFFSLRADGLTEGIQKSYYVLTSLYLVLVHDVVPSDAVSVTETHLSYFEPFNYVFFQPKCTWCEI